MLVFGQMNESPGARLRVPATALTIAEYFRDQERKNVLLFIDNIYRFVQAGMEVSALLGRVPSVLGYQPTLDTEMGALQERISNASLGSVTSVQAIYVPADDITDPGTAAAFAHLDAVAVLSRELASQGLYPAIDPLASSSRLLSPVVRGRGALRRGTRRSARCWRATPSCATSSPSSASRSCRRRSAVSPNARAGCSAS